MVGGGIADDETEVVGLGREVHADEKLDGITGGILELGFFKHEFRFADAVGEDTARGADTGSDDGNFRTLVAIGLWRP